MGAAAFEPLCPGFQASMPWNAALCRLRVGLVTVTLTAAVWRRLGAAARRRLCGAPRGFKLFRSVAMY